MTAELAQIATGQTAQVEIDGEWVSAEVFSVHAEPGKTNWVSVKLTESTEMLPSGVMVQGFNDTEFVNVAGDSVQPTIKLAS